MKDNNPARYEAEVPETLDLAERAELALNGICRTVDPCDDYLMYFEVRLNTRPPYLQHKGADATCTPKFAEVIPELRLMSGSDKFLDVEQGMVDSLVQCISEDDGLYYAVYTPRRPWHMQQHSSDTKPEDCAVVIASGAMMIALIIRRDLEDTAKWDDTIQGIVRGLESIAIKKDDYAFYPDGGFGEAFSYPQSGWLKTDEPMDEHEGGEGSVVCYHGYQIRALSMWAARTGDKQALDLAGKLARFVMKPKLWGNPSDPPLCSGRERGHVDSHFHARAIGLRGLLEYGLVTDDPYVCEFVRSSYEYMRSFGIPEIGFIPSYPEANTYMEGCYVGDLVALTIRLSEGGYGDYWEDADRIIRNTLAETQLLDKEMLKRIVAHSPERKPGSDYNLGPNDAIQRVKPQPGLEYAGDDVIDRALGIFAAKTDVASLDWMRVMQCCTANAARGLYHAWEAITSCEDDHARVNLLLNRAAPWLDVDSYLPYEGKVVIKNKTARFVSVRVPPWVRRSELECFVNDDPRRPCGWVGNYAMFDSMKAGNVLELRFPVPEHTIKRTAHVGTPEETVYTIKMRGNTVVDISPRDQSPRNYQYYMRDHMNGKEARMKKVSRYVSPVIPRW